ncbi:hypothetical protein [Bradyrhizobium sp. dw_411]|uniref:hypothetical protein n=1 Tax=Bradyrhizobium sp. dw_411 TaxID=2720082 RepID=UPI00201CA5B7|nr:hypothetical protein [Bradyrhizobium sp. dw_411]
MPLIRPRLTEFHGLDLAQASVDFAIPFLHEDLPLYVDPFLLWKSPSLQDQSLHGAMIAAFNRMDLLSKSGRAEQAVAMIQQMSECEEVGLGGATTKKGKRIGTPIAEQILKLFRTIPNIQARVSVMNEKQVEEFRKMAAQLDALHHEASAASKKHPDKPVSKFKVKLANSVLLIARKVLGTSAPAMDFDQFDIDELPTNSDLSFVVTQFVECAEKLKMQNVQRINGIWYWQVSDDTTDLVATAPRGVR